VEPVTHALASLALARAGKKHLPRFGTAMLIVAGVAPDLDYASYFGGAAWFLRFDRTLLHSLLASIVFIGVIGGAFYFVSATRDGRGDSGGGTPVRSKFPLGAALIVCMIGVAGHLLLDVVSGVGVQLLWPFRERWFAFDLVDNFDIWILAFLSVGLLLPMLTGLVSEEIGERKTSGRGRASAIAALVLIVAYVGIRGFLHSRAVDLLQSSDYHGRVPLAAGAFPKSMSPLEWRGVVSTDNTIEEVQVSFAGGHEFDPEHSYTQYKPDDSPVLQAGEQTDAAQRFLEYARFPVASVVGMGDRNRFELRDERFDTNDSGPANTLVRVEIGGGQQVLSEEFLFASSGR